MRRSNKQQTFELSPSQSDIGYSSKKNTFNTVNKIDMQCIMSNYDESQKQNFSNNTLNIYANQKTYDLYEDNSCVICKSGYSELVQQYYMCRKENNQLKNKIKVLQAKIAIFNQTSQLKQSGNPQLASQYSDRMKYLQEDYNQHRNNNYEHYQKQINHMQKIVNFLVNCYQQSLVSKNTWLADVMDKIKEKGALNTLKQPKLVQQILGIYEGKKKGQVSNKNQINKLDPGYSFDGEFGIGNIFDQKQSQVLRKRIRHLTIFIDSLIKLYRNQLSQLRKMATGRSQEILEEIKSCILRNFANTEKPKNKIIPEQKRGYLSDSWNKSESTTKNLIEKKIKLSNSNSNIKIKYPQSGSKTKNIRLDNSIQMTKVKKPPLPSGSVTNKNRKLDQQSSCNYSYIVQYPERQRRGSLNNPTPKSRTSAEKSKIGSGSASKNKRKTNKN